LALFRDDALAAAAELALAALDPRGLPSPGKDEEQS
jgi:hypothetical protein